MDDASVYIGNVRLRKEQPFIILRENPGAIGKIRVDSGRFGLIWDLICKMMSRTIDLKDRH